MQSVADKYYTWYNRATGLLGGLCASVALASLAVPGLAFLHLRWGFTPVSGAIGALQLVYSIVLFKRQSSAWVGGLLAGMLLIVTNLSIIQNSGQLHSWLLVFWAVQTVFAGMYGLYAVVGCDFLITVYYILEATGPKHKQFYDPTAIGAVFGIYVISVISYGFWRRFYVDRESRRISQLTGELKGQEEQSEILIQSISDGIIVTDTEGKISLLNPTAAKMTGWPVEEAVGIDVKLVAILTEEDGKPIDDADYPFAHVLQTGEQTNSLVQFVERGTKDPHVVSLIISPIQTTKTGKLIGVVAVFRDVSSAREEEHRRADFISTASHEMRTPVAAIEGYLALALNEKVSKIDGKARDFLTKAHESTQRLGTLFQDLLTSAKAEDGRLVNHPRVTEMGAYLEQLTEGLRFAAEKKGLLMDFTAGTSQPANGAVTGGNVVKPLYYAHLDPDRMREVITNLFDNAVKYTESGKVTIGLTGDSGVIQFFIRDTGHGIPAEDIPHLFQKFYRVDNSSTRTIGGTGLGLFICRKIVELCKGRIWVESDAGKGSTFYINLPRLTSEKARELQALEQQTQTV